MKVAFFPVCETDDIPQGERLFIEVGDKPVVIMNVEGEYFAIADVCTHDDGPLGDGDIENHQIICPRHGARFDIRTGDVLTLPAVRGVKSYPLKVEENMLYIGVEE